MCRLYLASFFSSDFVVSLVLFLCLIEAPYQSLSNICHRHV